MAQDNAKGLVYLLENLGFGVSKAKCQLEPTQTIDKVNSLTLELLMGGSERGHDHY